jgi:NADH-quinone oxidoreductase subunit L
LLGIFTLLATLGTVDLYRGTPNAEGEMAMQQPLFQALQQKAAPRVGSIATAHTRVPEGAFKGFEYGSVLTLAALLLFVGACGKSAQIPLFVWLPDAMAGPTPVSALIHAATMVTAGVYMLCRLNYVVADAPDAMLVIAFVGAGTALVAAIIGTMQDDIKKVLAYSTVSQLGFMILGCGVGAFWAGSLHLLTHAFFKACLFLGAGSVMHAMANETNIWKLGGLRKEIPLTHWTFLAATIAITGVLPFSGFFSKDAILDLTKHAHFPGAEWAGVLLYVMGTLAAGCTAYYMFRAYFLTFWGSRRSLPDHHPHEAGLMTFALVILGILSVVGLYWGLPIGHGFSTPWETYLENIFAPGHQALVAQKIIEGEESGLPVAAWGVALVVAWAGAGFAYFKYVMRPLAATDLASERPVGNGLVELVRHKFYVDELYDLVLIRPVKWLALNLWKVVDQLLIDKVLVGIWGVIADVTSGALRSFQNGSAQRYVAVMAISLAVILLLSPARAFFTHLFGH